VFLEGDYCGADMIDLDPVEGCLTFTQVEDLELDDEDWDKDLFEEEEEEEEEDFFDDDDDDDGYDPSEWN
jgi:hypothetical protein